jgi:ABC-type nitrate/sulfonate/bicarbonate transport system permease component
MRRPYLESVGRTVLGVAVFAVALGIWQVSATAANEYTFPPMTDVAERAWVEWQSEPFLEGVVGSLKRLAVGFAIGAALGVGVGLLVGSWRIARQLLEPLTELLRAVPVIAVVPIAIVLLDFGDAMRVSVIAFGVCFPVLVNTVEGVRAVPPEARDTASLLHVGRVERVFRINLPSALPSIMAGLRIAVSIGLILVVISELVGETGGLGVYNGLGEYISAMQDLQRVSDMYAGILFLGLLGYVLNRTFLVAERRVLRWHYGAIGEQTR